MELYREADVISEIRKGRLLWLRHVEIMPEDRTAKEVFKNISQKEKEPVENQEQDGWMM
jgi:hypothetical protein